MHEVRKRPLARQDLEDIWYYTHERWGKGQADRYFRKLDVALQRLAEDPERGKAVEQVRPGYWSLHVGRHVVFYTFTESVISVRRVLHDQMDVGRHV